MQITEHNAKVEAEVVSTTRFMKKEVPITFEHEGQTDEIIVRIFYEDRDGEKWVDHWDTDDSPADFCNRDSLADDILIDLQNKIKGGTSHIKENFAITQDLYNYVDNIIEEAMKEEEIYEEN